MFLVFYIQTVNIQYSNMNIQYSNLNIQYSYNYDLPHYSLFFYKELRPLLQPTKTQCIPLNEYYLMAEVVQKMSNYKQNMLLVNCNRLLSVGKHW